MLLVPVSSYRYQLRQNDDDLYERLIALAREKLRFGYRRLHVLQGREGEHVNHERVHRIYRIYAQPGEPTQNGYVESFNGKLREECLHINCFQNLFEARCIITNW